MGYESDADGIAREGGGDPDRAPLDWTEPMMYCVQLRNTLGRKLGPKDAKHDGRLEEGCIDFLVQFDGDTGFEFLDNLVATVNGGKPLSHGQIAGCVNTMYVEFDRDRKASQQPPPPTDLSSAKHRADGMVAMAYPNGYFHATHNNRPHIFRLTTCKERGRRPGTQVIGLRVGTVSRYTFKDFGFVVGSVVEPWSNTRLGTKIEDAARALMLSDFRWAGWRYAKFTGCCYRCGNPLIRESRTGLDTNCERILSVTFGDLTPKEPDYTAVEKQLAQKHIFQQEVDKGPISKADRFAAMYGAVDLSDGPDYAEIEEDVDEGDGIEFRNDGPDQED